MPVTLPLELVLDIVSLYIQRDFFDEDWAPYHHRLAPLCLVCKDVKELVQPVLWSYLPNAAFEELYELFAPDSKARHLFKHVQGFAADSLADYVVGGPEGDEGEFALVYGALSHVACVRLLDCDIQLHNIARFAGTPNSVFEKGEVDSEVVVLGLRSLTLEGHELGEAAESLVFPALESLSLVDIRTWDEYTVSFLLDASTTPSLRQLYLANIWIVGARSDEAYVPYGDVDLSRLSAVQLLPPETYQIPDNLWSPEGSFSADAAVMITADTSNDGFYFNAAECPRPFPPYFQLQLNISIPASETRKILPQLARDVACYLNPEPGDECEEGFKVAFLPSILRRGVDVDTRLVSSVKRLFSACEKGGVKVIFFRDSDETRTTMSAAFLKYLEDPSQPDQNPLVVEREQKPSEDRGDILWTSVSDAPTAEEHESDWEDEELDGQTEFGDEGEWDEYDHDGESDEDAYEDESDE